MAVMTVIERLKSCPFCGGKPRVYECTMYGIEARCVSCDGCGVKTPRILVNHASVTGNDKLTSEEAEQKAIELWERRVERCDC